MVGLEGGEKGESVKTEMLTRRIRRNCRVVKAAGGFPRGEIHSAASVATQSALPRYFLTDSFGCGFFGDVRDSGIFKNWGAAVVGLDFGRLPCRALVEPTGGLVLAGRQLSLPLFEAVEIRLVGGDPLLDPLPRWLGWLHGLDIEKERLENHR